ncbi:MAG: hypothetical protein ACRDSP_06800 [Pseudonocardiaceae bacterium]
MPIRSQLVTALTVGLLAAGGLTAGAGAAPFASADTVRLASGCAGPVCGTIRNNTDTHIAVCKNWYGSGNDQTYPDHGCRSSEVAYVKPHSTYGFPQFTDVDAFYIAPGTSYTGYWVDGVRHPGTQHNMTWRHVNQGWWKFTTNVIVTINSKSG